jgi:hypothetical protein
MIEFLANNMRRKNGFVGSKSNNNRISLSIIVHGIIALSVARKWPWPHDFIYKRQTNGGVEIAKTWP